MSIKYICAGPLIEGFLILCFTLFSHCHVFAQDAASVPSEQLPNVQVEAPVASGPARAERSEEGFGYGDPIPSGQAFSDYAPTRSEVVSESGRTQNLATVPSAITVIENKGVSALGNYGLPDIVQGQPGVFSMGGYAGNPFDAPIAIRGFTNETTNRTSLLLEGTSLNMPRQEANTNFVFPELIDRVEILRGDGTIQYGDKAIGGALNIILKKPRLNPGTYFGVEGGSWGQNREWAASNIVKGSVALGLFMGRYYQLPGWRTYYGDNGYAEPTSRPGPWALVNVYGDLNWKISPKITLDISNLITDERVADYNPIPIDKWQRRDIRNIWQDPFGYRPFDDPPENRIDNLTLVKLLYEGGYLGNLDLTWTGRTYDRSIPFYFGEGEDYEQRWTDSRIYATYTRTDRHSFLRNDLTLGAETANGKFSWEARNITLLPTYTYGLTHAAHIRGYRDSAAFWMTNQTRFMDRLILTLAYREEQYNLPGIYSSSIYSPYVVTANIYQHASDSEYALGFVYDRQLGSDIYYKHSTPFRFPNFDDMINEEWNPLNPAVNPEPIWLLQPEGGSLDEIGIRHWFTRNVYLGATWYKLAMQNEIYWGPDPNPAAHGTSRNLNVPNIVHLGVEVESLLKITPRWTLKSNYTWQHVYFGASWEPQNPYSNPYGQSTKRKWVPLVPEDMANVYLIYDNKAWGFSGQIAYYYVGSRFLLNDVLNDWKDLSSVHWGDMSFSQKFWDGLLELYCGMRNFSDRAYALQGTYASYYPMPWTFDYYSNAGRTCYFGLKTNLDSDTMRVPTTQDLTRMQRRLYGSVSDGLSSIQGAASWMRNLTPF